MTRIGSDLYINTDKSLEIKLNSEFDVLSNIQNWSEKYKGWLEPQKYADIMAKYDDLRPSNPCWLPHSYDTRIEMWVVNYLNSPIGSTSNSTSLIFF